MCIKMVGLIVNSIPPYNNGVLLEREREREGLSDDDFLEVSSNRDQEIPNTNVIKQRPFSGYKMQL